MVIKRDIYKINRNICRDRVDIHKIKRPAGIIVRAMKSKKMSIGDSRSKIIPVTGPVPLVNVTKRVQVKAMRTSEKFRMRSASKFLSTYDLEMAKSAEKLTVQDSSVTAPIKGAVVLRDDAAHEHSGASAPL